MNGGAVLLKPREWRWECLSCDFTDVTHGNQFHTRFHSCRGLRGLSIAMVPAGTKGTHVINEREDWIGKEDVQLDGEGRPTMSVVTIREDGQDCTVYAPCATAVSEG